MIKPYFQIQINHVNPLSKIPFQWLKLVETRREKQTAKQLTFAFDIGFQI